MIVCPNCNHQNPDGAVQCEACYTPLPAMMECPNCSASVQSDASFCGQCGFNLKGSQAGGESGPPPPPDVSPSTVSPDIDVPDLVAPDPLVELDPVVAPVPDPVISSEPQGTPDPAVSMSPPSPVPVASTPPSSPVPGGMGSTQLQTQTARLLHVQTNTILELPSHLSVVHIGKPNDRIPPDIDVSGFADAEIVSRVHADIRVEGDAYYVEDAGSSNGTYINNMALPAGNRHRLRPGDRIALGKGDKVSFLFQLG